MRPRSNSSLFNKTFINPLKPEKKENNMKVLFPDIRRIISLYGDSQPSSACTKLKMGMERVMEG
jgi:hypothetical protein